MRKSLKKKNFVGDDDDKDNAISVDYEIITHPSTPDDNYINPDGYRNDKFEPKSPVDCCLKDKCTTPSFTTKSPSLTRVLTNRKRVLKWHDRSCIIFLLVH